MNYTPENKMQYGSCCRVEFVSNTVASLNMPSSGHTVPQSKFKMAAVRHLGILISSYRTTYEVYSLVYTSLSNFVLIRYVILKISGFDFFAELAWNAYLRPTITVFGDGPLKIIDHRRYPKKAHLHLILIITRVMSINSFDSVYICDM